MRYLNCHAFPKKNSIIVFGICVRLTPGFSLVRYVISFMRGLLL